MLDQILDDTRQDAKAVFRTPNNVVITLPNYMTLLLVFTHFAKLSNLGIAPKNITTTKVVDYIELKNPNCISHLILLQRLNTQKFHSALIEYF